MHRSVFLILVLLTLATTIHGQSTSQREMISNIDTSLFKGLRYRLVGPSRGGRVTTVTGVPSQPKTFYMGVASGGLFRTTDNGATGFQSLTAKCRWVQPAQLQLRIRSKHNLPRHWF